MTIIAKKTTSKKSITPTSIAIEAVKLSPTAAVVQLAQTSTRFNAPSGGPLDKYNAGGHFVDKARPLIRICEISEALRTLRREVDYGTGSAVAGDGESEYAIAHRLTAHDLITCIETELEGVEGFIHDVVLAAAAEVKAGAA